MLEGGRVEGCAPGEHGAAGVALDRVIWNGEPLACEEHVAVSQAADGGDQEAGFLAAAEVLDVRAHASEQLRGDANIDSARFLGGRL